MGLVSRAVRPPRVRFVRAGLATVLVAALALVFGLSGGAAAQGSASAAKGSPVKIGVLEAVNSSIASFPEQPAAIKSAIRAINAQGGFNHHPVVGVYCDGMTSATVEVACANKFVADHVIAVTGLSLDDVQTVPIFVAAGIPLVGWFGPTTESGNQSNEFLFDPGAGYGYEMAGAYAGHEKWPVEVAAEATTQAAPVVALVSGAITGAGGKVAGSLEIPVTTSDYAPVVETAKQGGATAVDFVTSFQQGELFIQASEQLGAFQHYLSDDAFSTGADIATLGAAADKLVTASPFPPIADTSILGVRMLRKDLAAEQASGDSNAALGLVDSRTWDGWLAIYAIDQVTKHMKSITAASVMKALKAAKKINMFGAIEPWTPSHSVGVAGLPRVSDDQEYIIGIKKGKGYLITKKPITLGQLQAGKL